MAENTPSLWFSRDSKIIASTIVDWRFNFMKKKCKKGFELKEGYILSSCGKEMIKSAAFKNGKRERINVWKVIKKIMMFGEEVKKGKRSESDIKWRICILSYSVILLNFDFTLLWKNI